MRAGGDGTGGDHGGGEVAEFDVTPLAEAPKLVEGLRLAQPTGCHDDSDGRGNRPIGLQRDPKVRGCERQGLHLVLRSFLADQRNRMIEGGLRESGVGQVGSVPVMPEVDKRTAVVQFVLCAWCEDRCPDPVIGDHLFWSARRPRPPLSQQGRFGPRAVRRVRDLVAGVFVFLHEHKAFIGHRGYADSSDAREYDGGFRGRNHMSQCCQERWDFRRPRCDERFAHVRK